MATLATGVEDTGISGCADRCAMRSGGVRAC